MLKGACKTIGRKKVVNAYLSAKEPSKPMSVTLHIASLARRIRGSSSQSPPQPATSSNSTREKLLDQPQRQPPVRIVLKTDRSTAEG